MELEFVLSNLTDYVDLGMKLLESKSITCFEDALNAFAKEERLTKIITDEFFIDDLLDEYDLNDIGRYLNRKYSCSDVIDACEFSSYEMGEYVANSNLAESVLSEMSKSDLREYLRDNYDWDDFVDVDWKY